MECQRFGVLKRGKPTGHTEVFHLERALERLAQPVSQRLHRRRWHGLAAATLEVRRQVVLRGKRAVGLVLRFQRRQHLVVDGSRFDQAGHQLLALGAVGIQPVLERPHILIVSL